MTKNNGYCTACKNFFNMEDHVSHSFFRVMFCPACLDSLTIIEDDDEKIDRSNLEKW